MNNLNINAAYFGYDVQESYRHISKQISEFLNKEFPDSSIAFLVGTGGNGLDALYIASLIDDATVYLAHPKSYYSNEARVLINKIQHVIEISSSKDIEHHDVIVEGLVGIGLQGNTLRSKYSSIIKRVAHLGTILVALDQPAPGYSYDYCLSINTPKVLDAKVFTSIEFTQIDSLIGPEEVVNVYGNLQLIKSITKNVLIISKNHFPLSNSFARIYNAEFAYVTFEQLRSVHYLAKDLADLINQSSIIIIDEYEQTVVNQAVISFILQTYPHKRYVFNTYCKYYQNCNIEKLRESLFIVTRENFINPRQIHSTVVSMGLTTQIQHFDGTKKHLQKSMEATHDSIQTIMQLVAIGQEALFLNGQAALFVAQLSQILVSQNAELTLEQSIKEAIQECIEFAESINE